MKPLAEIAACCSSHRRLLAHLAPMTDDEFGAPSLLPRYTRGHVVAHLTNKTNAHIGHHLRNVEVHHVDLDIGYQASDWPAIFVEAELAQRPNTLADRADQASLLAWLLDRAPAPQLAPW